MTNRTPLKVESDDIICTQRSRSDLPVRRTSCNLKIHRRIEMNSDVSPANSAASKLAAARENVLQAEVEGLDEILARPGSTWTTKEREVVVNWLTVYAHDFLEEVARSVARQLGRHHLAQSDSDFAADCIRRFMEGRWP